MQFGQLKRRDFITLLGGAATARPFALLFLTASLLTLSSASAQTYPSRPITLVVPYPPGGATDAIARIIQDSMSQSLGQQIVIENIGGAGGMIAAGRAARAAPDGYTVLLHQVALAAGMTLYPNLTFDAEKDFVTIGLINNAASTLAARPTLPPMSFKEMLHWAKEPGREIHIGHAGVGSFGHLAGVLAAQELGIAATQVPYRGAGPALVDLLSGQIDMSSISAVAAGPLIKTGKLKAYAIIGRTRFSGLPDLPTLGELGYKKLDLEFWHMLLAPAGTPRPVIDRLNVALRYAMADAKVKKTFAEGGMDPFPPEQETPEAAAALLKSEIKLWGDVIRANNISAQFWSRKCGRRSLADDLRIVVDGSSCRRCCSSAGERHLLVGAQLRHQRGRFQPLLHFGHRGGHVGDRQAVGRCDSLDPESFDQVVEPIAIDVHVGKLGPEQREVREHRRHIRQVKRGCLFGNQAAVAVLVIVAVGEAVAREQHTLARLKTPPGRAQVADDRLDRHQAAAAEVDLVALFHPPHAMFVLWERQVIIAYIAA